MKEVLRIILSVLLFDAICAVNDRYYPRYHLAPTKGWMNDPNGFCYFNSLYHLFYQYNPLSSLEPGIANWGHATSTDLLHWEHQPIALKPNDTYDSDGAFSGSALIENNVMYLYYTGNVNIPGANGETSHIERQALATSEDGIAVTKYENNPIILGEQYQPDLRDPKVWKHRDTYYMVLGNSYQNETLGRIVLYTSKDKYNWEPTSIVAASRGRLGYMWECPDLFEINGKFVLLFSPQGVKAEGYKYNNLYQVGYIVGDFDYETNEFTPITKFIELDHGHDFYATQTMLDKHGRRLVVAWFDMWEQDYPEGPDGFTGMMTLVRELVLTKDNTLVQKPLKELKAIRNTTLYKGKNQLKESVELFDKAGEILIDGNSHKNLEVHIESEDKSSKVIIKYDHTYGMVYLNRGGSDSERRYPWRPAKDEFNWRIFVDASSIELFCGEGEVTFSSRFFPKGDISVRVTTKVKSLTVISLTRTVPAPSQE